MTQMVDDSAAADVPANQTLPHGRRRRGMVFLGLAAAGVGFAMALQMGLNANFLVEDLGVSGLQRGLLDATRETCGIVAFGVLALLAGLAEPLVGSVMLVLFAVGLGSYMFVPDFTWVIVASLVWSQGLHVWMPLPNSMALALAEPGRAGYRLGQIRAAGAGGAGLGLTVALGLTLWGVAIRPLYLLAGAAGLLAAAALFGIPRDIRTPGPRLVFRRKYGLYYLLSFLEGWRKQIFVCFAGFLLVRVHGARVHTMLVLRIVVTAIGYLASPRVGRLIDRIGERRILVFYYACLTCFFAGYALIPNRWVLYVLFVVDSAFFVFIAALTTYVNRIAPPGEHTATLSMGVAMNHVAAVTMPLVGGLLWHHLGYEWTFLIGSAAAALSILAALRVPKHTPPAGARHTPVSLK